jgi:UDP-glucose 4-epimerase
MQNMKQGMVSIYLYYVLFRESLLVKGSLERYRDLVYVSDVVNLMVNSIDDKRTFNDVFNVGTGKKTLIKDLIALILKTIGKPNFPVEVGQSTPGDTFGSLADVSYIKEVLNWEARVSLEQGMTEMVRFYSSIG